jgi:integrase
MFLFRRCACTWSVTTLKETAGRSLPSTMAKMLAPSFCQNLPATLVVLLLLGPLMRIMERVRERVGLPALTPHTLRHQRCTILKRAGVSLDDMALFAGHRSTESTRLYIHLAPSELSKRIRAKVEPFDAPIQALVEQTIAKAVLHER